MLEEQSVGGSLPGVGQRVAGRYIIEAELGRGGMGAVFRAHHETTRRAVAIKWMLPAFAQDARAVARFIREAKLAAAVDHENIVDVYDVGQEEGGFFIIMEFLRGVALSARLEQGPLATGELLEIFAGVCAGMDVAHEAGIVHRDLKPDNIFLAETRASKARMIPKIVDFGVSKALDPSESSMRLTGAGVAMGTPYYMSPEQIRSAADVDRTADVYALGVIAYECLSGVLPFTADSIAGIIVQVVTEEPKPLREVAPTVPVGVAAAVHRAMAKAATQRFQTAGDFLEALKLGAAAGTAPQPVLRVTSAATGRDFAASPRPPGQRHPGRLALGVACAVIVAVGVAGWLALGSDSGSAPTAPPVASTPAVPATAPHVAPAGAPPVGAAAPTEATGAADAPGPAEAPAVAAVPHPSVSAAPATTLSHSTASGRQARAERAAPAEIPTTPSAMEAPPARRATAESEAAVPAMTTRSVGRLNTTASEDDL